MPSDTQRPLIALTVGDPSGIGPELVRAALCDAALREEVRLVVIGPVAERPSDGPPLARELGPREQQESVWIPVPTSDRWVLGRAQRASGRLALAALAIGAELAKSGRVDALVTAPVCKEALHMAGERVEGQTELLARWAGVTRYQMVGISGELRVMLLTRHMPLRSAIEAVKTPLVVEHLRLFDESLRQLGLARPRIALAGLNPHAGEAGLLGCEEGDVLAPAVELVRAEGLDVTGPLSPDTVFLQASEGAYDGVLALYHDQAFIPLKLLSAGRGLTWIAGLPYLRLSPVHGTAFDIAGKGIARSENLIHAIRTAGRLRRSPG